ELERLNPKDLANNVYIRYPVMMEQYLMEGSYNSVFLAKGTVPASSYNYFVEILLHTIRNDIADCLEKAYKSISIDEVGKLLFFSNKKELSDFIDKKHWIVRGSKINFVNNDISGAKSGLKPYELTINSLMYAKELEKIV
ncbi:unnamed protein product, partial [Gordionus sp. m RMFG-2023]